MNEIINELLRFSDKILTIGEQILDDRIFAFEQKYEVRIPDDFREFISKLNGINLLGTQVLGFNADSPQSIEAVYLFEHFEVAVPQFHYIIPFSPDGGGNFYCFDTSQRQDDGCCPVIFWVSNYLYTEQDAPEKVNEDFGDWLKQVVIDWTLQDYNYDGTRKP